MDIQGIPGFQLTARTVTAADGRSPTRAQRPHSANISNRFRSPADMGTVDFRKGLEVYIPPKPVKRPNSSQTQRKSRSKETFRRYGSKVSCSQLRENVLDVKETEKELQAMTSVDKDEIAPQAQALHTRKSDTEVFESSEYQQGSSRPSPDSQVTDTGMVCTCGGLDDVGVENKRHGDYASSQESKAWFEKTLQEYEDLNKSVKAHISSAPSDQRNELVSGTDPRCVQLLWEEVSLQYKTSRIHTDEVDKKKGISAVSPACSPAFSLTTYTCGCPAASCSIRPQSNLDMTKVQDAAWKEMVDAVSQLRETNRALQQTVKVLQDPPHHNKLWERICFGLSYTIIVAFLVTEAIDHYKDPHLVTEQRYELGVPTEFAKPSGPPHSPGLSSTFHEPELRKRILGTLRSSVYRMESLMVALRDEQEKSKLLSLQLQGFLSASNEKTPPISVNWRTSTSPVQRVSLVGGDSCHQKPPSRFERKDHSRSPSPTPVLCALNTDAAKEKLPKVGNLSAPLCDVQVVSLSDDELACRTVRSHSS